MSNEASEYNELLDIVSDIVNAGHMDQESLARMRAHLGHKPAALTQQPQHNKVTDAQRDAVARAICIACEDHPDSAGDSNIGGNRNEFRWQDYRDVADAAIQAMQKETK